MRNIYPLNPRFTLPFVFLLIVSLLFMLPGGLIFGQSPDDTIEYPENGTDQVAIFTATDPENAGAIVWSLSGDDVEHFDIDEADGVLSFKEAPDYEMSADDDGNNIYSVMVVATDADDMTTEKAVTIEVTNVDEDGKITLDKMAPYPGILLTATLADPDMMEAGSAEWQWSRSRSENGSYTDIEDADEAAYTPTSGDVDHYLRATVGYNDGEGDDKSAMMTSANEVQTFNVPNVAPIFPDQDPEDPGEQSEDATRMVVENTDAGEDIGDPVAAGDANDDILTYTLGDTPADNAFDIDPATGQIKTKADLDADENASYDVIVTATDPAGLDDTIMVAITVTDVNEPPDITGDVEPYAENGTGDVADFTATDPEDQGNVTLDLSGTDAALFELSNGTLTFEASPNYEMPGDADNNNVYEVTVGATDGDGIRATKDVEVKVTNVEEDGTVTFSAVQPRVGIPLTARVTDIDGAVSGVMWQWSKNGAAIDDATSNTYTPVAADAGSPLTATATYTDPEGSDTAEDQSANSVAADTRNKPPAFDADQDAATEGDQAEAKRTVEENAAAPASVDGGAVTADDPNTDDMLTYTLGGPDASSFDIGSASGQIMVGAGTKLDFETKSTYMVTVIATDSFGESDSVEVIITVTDMNEGPAVTGTVDADHAENGTGSVATYTAVDPEGKAVVWSLSGDDVEHFDIDEADGVLTFKEAPDYEMSADDDGNNIYSVMVVATDADDMTTEKAVTIEVTNVDEDGKITLDKMAPYPGILLTATLADPDMMEAGSAEWQWSRSRSENGSYTDIEDADEAAYTPTSGDVDHYLRATVGYNDGEGDDKSAMMTSANEVQAVNVPNVAPIFPDQDPEDPGEQSEDATRMVVENTDAGEDIGDPVAAGDANDDILTYTLGDTPADNAFDIDPATGQIKTKADLDADENASYDVIVTATDPAGLDDTIMVAITVTDVNEPPDITGDVEPYAENGTGDVADFTATDPEDQGNVTLDLSGTDAALFELSNGTLTFEASPNYEMPGDADNNNVYEVTVGATDGDGIRATKDVEVKVTNVEEDGTVTFSAVQPRVGIPLTARVTDIDGAVSGVMWQWSKNGAAIDDATSNTYTPVAADAGSPLTATATYTDPEGSDTAEDQSANSVAADTRNKPPAFDADQDAATEGDQAEAKRTVEENAAAPASVDGGAVTADDPNTDDMLTYTLGGPDASSFDIGSASGQIMVGAGTKLDFETKSTYMVTVIATDSFGESDSVEVIITVTDMNEGPEIMIGGLSISGRSSVNYAENGTGAVATYTANGPDAASARWSLDGDDAGDFRISTAGVLTFRSSPDYEMAADADGDNTYMVTVKADDGTYMDTHEVVITVTDVDEVPLEISGMSNVDYAENGTGPVATYMVAGYNAASAAWTLEGPDAGDFTISGGVLVFSRSPNFESPADADTDNTYMVTVKAAAGADMDTHEVVIMVTDVDEVPLEISGMSNVDYAENGTGPVATYMVAGANAASAAWTLEGPDADDFTISGGVLTFKNPPDYETKTTYMVTVKASAGADMDTQDVVITVTDVDEMAPEMSLLERYDADGNDQIDKSEALTAIADYIFEGILTKDQALDVISLYLFGSS